MDDNNLKKLKDRLYKKQEEFGERKREVGFNKNYREYDAPPPSYWINQNKEKTNTKIMKNILIFSIVVCIIALGVLYFLLAGPNIISSKNINIKIKGPVNVDGGKIVNLNVVIENKNKTPLELADLIFEFPDTVSVLIPQLRLFLLK